MVEKLHTSIREYQNVIQLMYVEKPPRLAVCIKVPSLLYGNLSGQKASCKIHTISNLLSLENEDRECNDYALRVPLRKPPCRTYKKEQASIKQQAYLLKPRSKQTKQDGQIPKTLVVVEYFNLW